MMTYTACFHGRTIGAIGVMRYFNVDIEADDEEMATFKLYHTHEHIQRLFWLWPGKQTVCNHKPTDYALYSKGFDVYVSTYNGNTWKQTSCNLYDVEKVKAEHLADEAFMNNYGRKL